MFVRTLIIRALERMAIAPAVTRPVSLEVSEFVIFMRRRGYTPGQITAIVAQANETYTGHLSPTQGVLS